VFSTIATSVGPPGVSVTEAGSGAQVIVGEDVVQLKVTVPLKPGIDVSTIPIANLPPGGTGGKAPPAGGVTEIEMGELETVSTVDPVTLSNVAEIVVVKAVVAPVVASPVALIVAAWVFEDAQATVEVMSFVLLSEKVPVAVNGSVELIGRVGFAGVTAIDFSVGPVLPLNVTVTVTSVVVRDTMHDGGFVCGLLGVQFALNPPNEEPCAGEAVSTTALLSVNGATQTVGQLIPAGWLVTVPLPLPFSVTVMLFCPGAFSPKIARPDTNSEGAVKLVSWLPLAMSNL
jgi:hypothetical protein